MKFAVLSSSLDPQSKSRLLANETCTRLIGLGHEVSFIDLRERALPQFDNAVAFEHPEFIGLHREISEAHGVFIASPVYNWGLASSAKSLIELTGATGEKGRIAAWFDKIVTFICSGGLPHSYMAYGPLALSLMLDFKCVINPYAVYAAGRDFDEEGKPDKKLLTRLDKTIAVKIELTEALFHRKYKSGWEV